MNIASSNPDPNIRIAASEVAAQNAQPEEIQQIATASNGTAYWGISVGKLPACSKGRAEPSSRSLGVQVSTTRSLLAIGLPNPLAPYFVLLTRSATSGRFRAASFSQQTRRVACEPGDRPSRSAGGPEGLVVAERD